MHAISNNFLDGLLLLTVNDDDDNDNDNNDDEYDTGVADGADNSRGPPLAPGGSWVAKIIGRTLDIFE